MSNSVYVAVHASDPHPQVGAAWGPWGLPGVGEERRPHWKYPQWE